MEREGMTETWIPWCIRHPGPPDKQGYTGAPFRTLTQIEGEVKHDAQGGLAYLLNYNAGLTDTAQRKSWTFSIAEDGTTYQHYPLEAITWHAGVIGDERRDTSLIGNLTLVGEEHAGSGVIRGPQLASSLRLTRDIRALCNTGPPVRLKNLFEHRELSWTFCPNGRIPWQAFLEEDNVTADELKAAIREVIVEMLAAPDGIPNKGAVRILCGEAIDAFVGPDLGVAPERAIARSVEVAKMTAPSRSGTWATNA